MAEQPTMHVTIRPLTRFDPEDRAHVAAAVEAVAQALDFLLPGRRTMVVSRRPDDDGSRGCVVSTFSAEATVKLVRDMHHEAAEALGKRP